MVTSCMCCAAYTYRPGRFGLLNPVLLVCFGCKSSMTDCSVISLGSSTSNFFASVNCASFSAMSSTARFIRGYSMRLLMLLFPGVTGHV